ncbi:alpha/beta fold hydrolase [Xylophilus sp. GOD-11R]|uniref:alpha/beta fold hydrolase n=1 Tax=Xylophilus sp. GOD-11R TaxID=3089814 RepID=UPI00298D0230|nr:alpha/beta fold hydrolase [Xylophilus sp. GOD-11R]WPB55566.1 alpha/beta fold hydrolase [Xylophilus sp. GOD-11R]
MTHPRPPLHTVQLADGPGVPIVLSHALGLDHRMWLSTAQALDGRHPVLAFDHRGHGASPRMAAPWTMDDVTDDAAAVVEGWGRGPVVFVGLSMGGMAGQGLGIRRPELVRGLVLSHTAARYGDAAREGWKQRVATVQAEGLEAVVETVLQRYLTEPVRVAQPAQVEAMRQTLLANDAASYCAACQAVAGVDWLDRLHAIDRPTAVIAGAHDAGATPAMARDIHERIAGSTLDILPDASHLGPIEQPDAFMAALARGIGRVG